MCTLSFAWQFHPRYSFVFAGNRDEFHQRPTQAAQWWPDAQILAGRDVEAGGTWLGVDRHGRFAVVTNFREGRAADKSRRSRGQLVVDFFSYQDTDQFRQQLHRSANTHSGYSLVFGELSSALYHHSNRGSSGGINRGIHGLSNRLLDTPWPKVTRTMQALEELLHEPMIETDALFSILADRTRAPSRDLPDTGVGEELESLLSSTFIISPDYGTRSSTVILLDRDGQLQFVERSFDPAGELTGERRFEFLIA